MVVDLTRPSREETLKNVQRTAKALGLILDAKQGFAARPQEEQLVEYTTTNNQTRIIQISDKKTDPIEPAKFRVKKATILHEMDTEPIMHSPRRKLTREDQEMWNIPPCISNYKNHRGYVIPLPVRMAADGSRLIKHTIGNRFGGLADALENVENLTRQEIETRNKLRSELKLHEKRVADQEIDELARLARERLHKKRRDPTSDPKVKEERSEDEAEPENLERRQERERLRQERQLERKREYRLEQRNLKKKARGTRAGYIERQKTRDISEKIALGQLASKKLTAENRFDSRLFNQDKNKESIVDQRFYMN